MCNSRETGARDKFLESLGYLNLLSLRCATTCGLAACKMKGISIAPKIFPVVCERWRTQIEL